MDQKKLLEINKLRGLFPKVLEVGIKRSENGGFVAAIKTLPGCATQGARTAQDFVVCPSLVVCSGMRGCGKPAFAIPD